MTDCLFCRIVAGEIPADVVMRTPDVVAFRDIDPQAPTHILIVPTTHAANAAEWATIDAQAAGALLAAAGEVAQLEGLDGYRLVFNTGESAGQSVFHVHGHVLGGRDLTWPPG